MSELQIIFLALLQGITEFLPVSSSGHLILFSKFTSFTDQGLATDVALHIGSIAAVILYFLPTLWRVAKDLWVTKLYLILSLPETSFFTYWSLPPFLL